MSERKLVSVALCPICKCPFVADTNEEVIRKIREHARKGHERKAFMIRVKRTWSLRKSPII